MLSRLTTGQKVALGVAVPGTALMAYLLWRSSREDDDVTEAVVTSRQTVITVTIPHHAVGGVIGRQGANIKEIQAISGARVNFNDRGMEKNDTSDRVVTIRGTAQAAQKAQLMIAKIISELPVKTSFEITVPQRVVGRIIGKGGDSINEIRQISHARITIGQGSREVQFIPVLLEGTQQEIDLAKGLIEDIVAEAADDSRQWTAESVASRPERRRGRNPEEQVREHVQHNEVLPPPRTAAWPSGDAAYIEVFISAVEHPHHFWCQIVSGASAQLDSLVQQMSVYYKNSEKVQMNLEVDDLVAAPFEWDQAWYRAKVLEVMDTEVDLYYVDFGDSCVIPREQVRPLRSDYLRLAFQAVECRLAGVEPANNKDWSDEACAMFEDMTYCAKWKVIIAQAQSYLQTDNGVMPCLKLVDTHGTEDVDIAAALISAGHASRPPSPSERTPPSSPGSANQSPSPRSANQSPSSRSSSANQSPFKTDRIAMKQVLDRGKLEAE